ncbi:MAG: hypothetical protein GY943_36200, partial [Chloroflexi bacterium]|nr:hypothetical protein [Chloroflexota bacterium]
TATEFDRVFFLPSGQLPPGTGETYAFNLGGNSDYEFQKPITVSLKNSRGFDPGMVIPLGYWNQHTLQWEHESVAIVDDTGEWVVMQTTHFSNHDPNFPILASDFDVSATDKTENDDSCADGESGCFINLQSGSLREWIDLPMVNVAGDSAGPQLAYNTDRANPSAIIDVQFDINLVGSVIAEHMTWELYIEGEKTDTLTFASNLSQVGEVGRYRYMWDGRNALGELLPPGVYPYAVKIGLTYGAEYCRGPNSRFGADACVEGTEFYVPASQDMWVYGEVTLNTQQENGLGAGWVIEGQQSIYEDEAGRVLIAEDDALTQYYFDFKDLLSGAAAYSAAQPTVVGPASVDFPVTEISGGTDVSGIININTTWTMAQSPYVIKDDDVTVASGATLTIEPGVQVLLDDGRNVIVEGVLDAQATATNPITFTAHYDPNNQTAVANEGFETYLFYYDDTYPLTAKATTVDADNALWIAGDGYDNVLNNDLLALVRQDADLTTRQQIPFPVGTESSGVRDLAVDGSGRKWVATDQGVFMLAA